MTKDRQKEIKLEAERRINLWLQNSTWAELTEYGSYQEFNYSLMLFGFNYKRKKWMGDDFKIFVSQEEFYSNEYDKIISDLWVKYQQIPQNKIIKEARVCIRVLEVEKRILEFRAKELKITVSNLIRTQFINQLKQK